MIINLMETAVEGFLHPAFFFNLTANKQTNHNYETKVERSGFMKCNLNHN